MGIRGWFPARPPARTGGIIWAWLLVIMLIPMGLPSTGWAHTPQEKSFYLQSRIVLQLNPKDARAGNAVGIWHLEYNEKAQSRAAFQNVLKHHPAHPLATVGLVLLAEAEGDNQWAFEHLKAGNIKDGNSKAGDLNAVPSRLGFFMALIEGRLLFKLNKTAQAGQVLRAALGQTEYTHDLYYWLGQVLEREKKWAQAEKAYLSAIKSEPFWPGPYSRLSLIYQRRGEEAKARDMLAQLVALENPSPYPNNDVGLLWLWVMRDE